MKKLLILLLSSGLLFGARNVQNDDEEADFNSMLRTETVTPDKVVNALDLYNTLQEINANLEGRRRAFRLAKSRLVRLGFSETVDARSYPPIHHFTKVAYCPVHNRDETNTLKLPEPR